jgi:transposase-like protein
MTKLSTNDINPIVNAFNSGKNRGDICREWEINSVQLYALVQLFGEPEDRPYMYRGRVSRFTPEDIAAIKTEFDRGDSRRLIAEKWGISRAYIYRLVHKLDT